MEDGAQVDVDHAVELLQGHLLQSRVLRDAGVVHQHVDAAVSRQHLGYHGCHARAVGHVQRMPLGLRTQ